MKKTNIFFLYFVLLGITPLIGQGSSEEKMIVQEQQEIAAPALLTPEAVSVSDYCHFLNAVAAKDSKNFYDQTVGADAKKECLMRSGLPGDYSYRVIPGKEEIPMSLVNQEEIAQYGYWKQDAFSAVVFEGSREVTETIDPLLKSNQLTFQIIATNAFAYQASGAGVAGMLSDDIMNALFAFTFGAAALAGGENTSALRDEANSRISREALPPRATVMDRSSTALEKSMALTTIRERQERQGEGEQFRRSSLPLMILGTTLRTLPLVVKRRISSLSMMSMRPWMRMTSPKFDFTPMLQAKRKEQGGEQSDSFSPKPFLRKVFLGLGALAVGQEIKDEFTSPSTKKIGSYERIPGRWNRLVAFCEEDAGKRVTTTLEKGMAENRRELLENIVTKNVRQNEALEAAKRDRDEKIVLLADHQSRTDMYRTGVTGLRLIRNALIASSLVSLAAQTVPPHYIPPDFTSLIKGVPRNKSFVLGASLVACGAHAAAWKLHRTVVKLEKDQEDFEEKVRIAQEYLKSLNQSELSLFVQTVSTSTVEEKNKQKNISSERFHHFFSSSAFDEELFFSNWLNAFWFPSTFDEELEPKIKAIQEACNDAVAARNEEAIKHYEEAIERTQRCQSFLEETIKKGKDRRKAESKKKSINLLLLELESKRLGAVVSLAIEKTRSATGEKKIQLWDQAIKIAREQQEKQRALITAQDKLLKDENFDQEAKKAMGEAITKSRYLEDMIASKILSLEADRLGDCISLAVDNAMKATEEKKIEFWDKAIETARAQQEKQRALITAQDKLLKDENFDQEAKKAMEESIERSRYYESRIAATILILEGGQLEDLVSFAIAKVKSATGEEKIKLWDEAIQKAKEQQKKQRAFIEVLDKLLEDKNFDKEEKMEREEIIKKSRCFEAAIAGTILILERSQLGDLVSFAIAKVKSATGEEKIKLWDEAIQKAKEQQKKQRAFIEVQDNLLKDGNLDKEAKEAIEDHITKSRYSESAGAARVLSLEADQLGACVSLAIEKAMSAIGEKKIEFWDKAIQKAVEQQEKQGAFIKAQEEAWKIAPNEKAKKAMGASINKSRYLEAKIDAKILSLEVDQLDDAVSLAIEKAMSAIGEKKIEFWDKAIQKAVEQQEKQGAFIKAQEEAWKIAPNEEAKESMGEAIKRSRYLEAKIDAKILSLEVDRLGDCVSLAIEKAMSATEEKKIEFWDKAIETAKAQQEKQRAFIEVLDKLLKDEDLDQEAKKEMKEVSKRSQSIGTQIVSRVLHIKAMKADEIALVNRDDSMVNNAAQAWADYANTLVNETDKKEKEEANYTSARWAAESLSKEAEAIDNAIQAMIMSKDIKSSSQDHGSEWVKKFIKAQQCKEAIRKLYDISYRLKDTDPRWRERSKEDETRYKRWECNCEAIEKKIAAHEKEDKAATQQDRLSAKEREAAYCKLCEQCSPWAQSIRDNAILGFFATVATTFIPAYYLPPALNDLIKKSHAGNIALGTSLATALGAHTVNLFCQPYVRGDKTLFADLEKEREERNRLFREKETASKVRDNFFLNLKYSSEFNAISSIPSPIGKYFSDTTQK